MFLWFILRVIQHMACNFQGLRDVIVVPYYSYCLTEDEYSDLCRFFKLN